MLSVAYTHPVTLSVLSTYIFFTSWFPYTLTSLPLLLHPSLKTNKQIEIVLYHFVYPFSISLIFLCMWGNGQVKSVAINGAWNQHQSKAKYWLFKGCYLLYWVCYPLCQVSQQIQVINLRLICFILCFSHEILAWLELEFWSVSKLL